MNDADLVKLMPKLPPATKEIVEELHSGKVLGASRNIRSINNLFCVIADAWENSDGNALVQTLAKTGNYFIENRGKNTPAIGNAINLVLYGLEDYSGQSVAEIQRFIHEKREAYNARSLNNVQKVAAYGANLLMDCDTVLPFDYSSSMLAVLHEVARRGKKLTLIVPESRDLDGGRPIVNEATEWGHSVKFVIDFAFHNELRHTDAVIIGAETIFSNGDCWNTVGSFPIAVLADYYHVPLYVPTELIKIDSRSFRGELKPMKMDNYAKILDYPGLFRHPELIDVEAPALDNVPHKFISAYITEAGVFPPENLWNVSLNFLQSIGKSPFGGNGNE
jgi:ribose 1,5-bisphosphate isomerase